MKAKIFKLIVIVSCLTKSVFGQNADTIIIKHIGSTDRLILPLMITKGVKDKCKEQNFDSLSQIKYLQCPECKLRDRNYTLLKNLCMKNKFISVKNEYGFAAFMITIKQPGYKDLNYYLSKDKSSGFFKWLSKKLDVKGFYQDLRTIFQKRGESLE